jgi:hypothetical protein
MSKTPSKERFAPQIVSVVKRLFEEMLREFYHAVRKYSEDISTSHGKRNFEQFSFIARKCSALGIKVEDFFTVMLDPKSWEGRNLKWKYPPLSFLASEAGFSIFIGRMRGMRSRFMTRKGAFSSVKSSNPLNFQSRFTNCFYNGYTILWSLLKSGRGKELNNVTSLFAVFLAYADVFTPEFIATHSRFEKFEDYWQRDKCIRDTVRAEVARAVIHYAAPVRARMVRDGNYVKKLIEARKGVAERELKSVQKAFGHIGNWRSLWWLMY